MAYSITDLLTKADCDLVLGPLAKKRDDAANRRTNLAFDLKNFGDPAARNAELTRLNRRIADAETDLPTMSENREKRKLEDEMGRHKARRNQLINQAETQGPDDQVLLEFELASVTAIHDEAVDLIRQVEIHKDTLAA